MQHKLQVQEAKMVDGIRGIEVEEIAAKIEGKMQEFRGGIKLAFGVERKYWRYIQ